MQKPENEPSMKIIFCAYKSILNNFKKIFTFIPRY